MNNILELSNEKKIRLAQHPNTPQETLAILATDEDSWVRFWVARHPNISQDTLAVLATDKDSRVRYWVVENSNATEMIRRLVLMTNEQHA